MAAKSRTAVVGSKFKTRSLEEDDRSIPDAVFELMNRTMRLYRLWWCAHYSFGLTGIVAGTLLAVLTTKVDSATNDSYALFIGIVATVSTSMVTFLGPLQKAERYWSAYHLLHQACLEFFNHEPDARTERLMRRVRQARKILQVAEPVEKPEEADDEGATPPAKGGVQLVG